MENLDDFLTCYRPSRDFEGIDEREDLICGMDWKL